MRTDKQICLIFEANPQWLFELTGLPSPGPCRFSSESLKAIEQTADGVVIPEDLHAGLTVVEIQFRRDEEIYLRIVIEMALMQQKLAGRPVQGVILFLNESMDPQTQPWCKVVRAFSLADSIGRLSATNPSHPLVAVFYPVLVESEEKLEYEAAACYNRIKTSDLVEPIKSVLLDVFVNWLEQRFAEKGKEEIEEMLIGQLPDLRETRSGKDLIAIGFREGEKSGLEQGIDQGIASGILRGKREALVQLLTAKFNELAPDLVDQIEQINEPEQLDRVFTAALHIHCIDELPLKR